MGICPIYHSACHMPRTSCKSCGKCQPYSHEPPQLPHSPREPCLPSLASRGTPGRGGCRVGSSGTLAEKADSSQGPSNPPSCAAQADARAVPRPTAPHQPQSWPSEAAQGPRWGPSSHLLEGPCAQATGLHSGGTPPPAGRFPELPPGPAALGLTRGQPPSTAWDVCAASSVRGPRPRPVSCR